MASASSSTTIHLQLNLSAKLSQLTPCATLSTAAATTADPRPLPSLKQRRSVNLPSRLSNLLHLSDSNKPYNSIDNPVSAAAITQQNLTPSPKEEISSLQPALHGSANWSHLLDPLHPWLRREIIKYGELSQATYDAFDADPFSPYCGSCLYGRHRLLDKLGLAHHGYHVTRYLYAMSHVELPRWLQRSLHSEAWSHDSNWMGLVAVSSDAESRRMGCRDIAVSWRGTSRPAEWYEDFQTKLEPVGPGHGEDTAKVEHGFHSLYTSKSDDTRYNKTSASEQVMEEIKRLVDFYKHKGEKFSLTITGHSLGGALALLNAYEAATSVPDIPVTVISFGAPRVGNTAFGDKLCEMGVKVLRLAVKQDLVPKMPGVWFNEVLKRFERGTGSPEWAYSHVGLELELDIGSSPYLKHGLDIPGYHSLETYLHLVDGYVSGDKVFRADARRDVALVNKACGMLKKELRIPACWCQVAKTELACAKYGRWVLPQREPEDIPSPYRNGGRPACTLELPNHQVGKV